MDYSAMPIIGHLFQAYDADLGISISKRACTALA